MNQGTIATISQAGRKPTADELNARIDTIVDLLGRGFQRKHIAQYLAKNMTWDISSRTLDRLIRRAKATLEKSGRQKADLVLGKVLYRLDSMYFQAMSDRDYDEALESIKILCRLYGLPIDPPAGRAAPQDDHLDRISIVITPEQMRRAEEQRLKQLPADPK